MAGFSWDAQRRYRIGEPQNVFGMAAAMIVVVVEFAGMEVGMLGVVCLRPMATSGLL
jgi:hypothetical protein